MKVFFKRKHPNKVFFQKQMTVRSFAYGKEVQKEFLDWKTWFSGNYSEVKGNLVLSAQGNACGNLFVENGKTPLSYGDSCLPPLRFDAMRFEVGKDGFVSVNGQKSAVHVGAELKAWAIATISGRYSTKSALFVIGKSGGSTKMSLTAYDLNRRGLSEKAEMSVPLETTLDAESYLICFGRHILLVHNSTLDYYYYHYERGELQRVAIGEDGNNEEFAWCKYVQRCIVAEDAGRIFWISDNDVYGFPIGYPRQLLHIQGSDREKTLHIRSDKQALLVYRKDRNSGKITCWRYADGENGRYEGTPQKTDAFQTIRR